MKKRLLLLPLLAGFALSGCEFKIPFTEKTIEFDFDLFGKKDKKENKEENGSGEEGGSETSSGVVSVAITGASSELNIGSTMQLGVDVTVNGSVAKGVNWSSSNEAVATVSSSGLVTPKSEGKVSITATSKVDATKSASVEITVVDKGFDPSYIDEGYTYSKGFPVDAIKAFIGEGSYEIIEPSSLVGGCYYVEYEEDDYGPACIQVVINSDDDYGYLMSLASAGFERLYVSSYDAYEGVDPTGAYTISFTATYDETAEEYVSPTVIEFYRSEDVWDTAPVTTDSAWSMEHNVGKEEYDSVAEYFISKIPFVAMGENYEFEYVYDNSMYDAIVEALASYGITPENTSAEEFEFYLALLGYEGPIEYFTIYDYNLAEVFNDYEATLLSAGCKKIEDEDGDEFYVLNDGSFDGIYLSFGFTEQGNTIIAQMGAAVLDAFPSDVVNQFASDVLGSIHTVPAYEETEGATFQAEVSFENGQIKVTVDNALLTEGADYAAKLELEGFEVEYHPETASSYPYWVATKGKLIVQFTLLQTYSSASQTWLDEGPLTIVVCADESKHEVKGIYLPENMMSVLANGPFDIAEKIEVVDIEEPAFYVVSSDESVATVEGTVITPVAAGETTITVSIPDTEYSASTVLTVSEKSEFELGLEECNAWLETLEADPILLPEPPYSAIDYEYDAEYDCFSFYIATSVTEEQYAAALVEAGFTYALIDGYEMYVSGNAQVSVWTSDEGEIEIDVYYYEGSVVGGGVVFDFSVMNTTSGEVEGYSFSTAKGSNTSSAPGYFEPELRIYVGNTITISAPEGESLTSIFFDANTCEHQKADASLSASAGEISAVDGGFLWEGEAESVTFTVVNGKQVHINSIQINGGGAGGGSHEELADDEKFIQELVYLLTGQTPELDVNYFDDDGFWTYFGSDDVNADIDAMFDYLSSYYYCMGLDQESSTPTEDEGAYGFFIISEDYSDYYAVVYSGEDSDGPYIELDIYSFAD